MRMKNKQKNSEFISKVTLCIIERNDGGCVHENIEVSEVRWYREFHDEISNNM